MVTRVTGIPLLVCLLPIFHLNVQAGPPAARSSRMVREVYPEVEPENDGNQAQVCIVGDVVYGMDEPVPAEQPCLKCRCQPPGVQCETIKCAKKPGCKAIHRPNKCCPDYQCECEHEGRTYANGERLETRPGGECKVCYCRGGEVQCAEVSCYIRTDCEAKTVPGQCCPKYDHCPPKEPLLGRPNYVANTTLPDVNREALELWPLTKLLQNATEETTTPTTYETPDANKILDYTPDNESVTFKTVEKNLDPPKITIHEIIPEIKEIPITSAPSRVSEEPEGQLIIEEHKEAIDSTVNDLVVTDSDTDSSEISEVFQHPPPVLRIGDKLLFLKQGELVSEKDASTPASVITIIGAEGLQRGFEDNSAELHEPPPKTDQTLFSTNSVELEPKTSESTHILSLVKHKKGLTTETPPQTTTELKPIESTTMNTLEETSTPLVSTPTEPVDVANETASEVTSTDASTAETVSNKTTEPTASTESSSNYETLLEENPAYPPIPDVMSPENIEKLTQRLDNIGNGARSTSSIPDTKILPEVLEIRSNKTVPQNISNGDWLKNGSSDDTLVNSRAALPDYILKQTAPSDLAETPTATDIVTTEETTTSNNETAEETTTVLTETSYFTEIDQRSMESVEEIKEDSGEATTPKNSHASILSNENASIEPSGPQSEATDMLIETKAQGLAAKIDDVELINGDLVVNDATTSNPLSKDVEMVNVEALKNRTEVNLRDEKLELPNSDLAETTTNPLSKNVEEVKNQTEISSTDKKLEQNPKTSVETTTNPLLKDVEMINVKAMKNETKDDKLQLPAKTIDKRENSPEDEGEEVFGQLDRELNAESTQRILTEEEDKKESDEIFQELLEDTTRSTKSPPLTRDQATLQRVSDVIARVTLGSRRSGQDGNIFSLLSDLFGYNGRRV